MSVKELTLNPKAMANETIVVANVKNVRIYVDETTANVTLTLDKTVKGFKRDENGAFVESDVDSINMFRSALTAQLCDLSDDIAMYRAVLGRAFGQKEFGVILFNAELTIKREFKAAGEVVNDKAIERDCYITTVTKVKLSDRALRALDNALAL